jgi:hypothetical protein
MAKHRGASEEDQKKADEFDALHERSRTSAPTGTHPSDRPLSDGPRSSDYRERSY